MLLYEKSAPGGVSCGSVAHAAVARASASRSSNAAPSSSPSQPPVCVRRFRTVTRPAASGSASANSGAYRRTAASRSTRARSASELTLRDCGDAELLERLRRGAALVLGPAHVLVVRADLGAKLVRIEPHLR